MKTEVDLFAPGRFIPSLQLKAEVLNQQQAAQKLKYMLRLNGAREPKNTFLVDLPRTTRGVSALNLHLLLPSFIYFNFIIINFLSIKGLQDHPLTQLES